MHTPTGYSPGTQQFLLDGHDQCPGRQGLGLGSDKSLAVRVRVGLGTSFMAYMQMKTTVIDQI